MWANVSKCQPIINQCKSLFLDTKKSYLILKLNPVLYILNPQSNFSFNLKLFYLNTAKLAKWYKYLHSKLDLNWKTRSVSVGVPLGSVGLFRGTNGDHVHRCLRSIRSFNVIPVEDPIQLWSFPTPTEPAYLDIILADGHFCDAYHRTTVLTCLSLSMFLHTTLYYNVVAVFWNFGICSTSTIFSFHWHCELFLFSKHAILWSKQFSVFAITSNYRQNVAFQLLNELCCIKNCWAK